MDDRAAKAERARKQLRKHREALRWKRESRILEGGAPPATSSPVEAPVPRSAPVEAPVPPAVAPVPATEPAEKETFASELWSQDAHAQEAEYEALFMPANTDSEPAPVTDLFASQAGEQTEPWAPRNDQQEDVSAPPPTDANDMSASQALESADLFAQPNDQKDEWAPQAKEQDDSCSQPSTAQGDLFPQSSTAQEDLFPQSSTAQEDLFPQPSTVQDDLFPQPSTVQDDLFAPPSTDQGDPFVQDTQQADLFAPESADHRDLFAPESTDQGDLFAPPPSDQDHASVSAPSAELFSHDPPRRSRFMEYLLAPSPQRPTAMDNYAASMEASMDQDREAAALFPTEDREPELGEPTYDLYGQSYDAAYQDPYEDQRYHGDQDPAAYDPMNQAHYGYEGYAYEDTYDNHAPQPGDTDPYPPYHDNGASTDTYGPGVDAFDPERMLDTMTDPAGSLSDSRTLDPIPEHQSDESREAEYGVETTQEEAPLEPAAHESVPSLPVDDLFASHGTESWKENAEPVPSDAFALEEAPFEDQPAEGLEAKLAEALARLETLVTECQTLVDAKEALTAQLDTQRMELEQCRQELADAHEQRLASERANADRMSELQREHQEAIQTLQSEHRAAMEALARRLEADAGPHAPTMQERRLSALVRAHKRSATTSLSSSRMSLAGAEAGEFLPRRQPSEKPRMRPDAALTPVQAHQRKASLQMLRARMASDAQDGVPAPAPPTSTLSIVQDQHRVASAVQDQVEMARTHSHQFSQDALLFCSSCEGDLIIV
ncbi:hypothetical protein MNAN1_000492 [Malassezia nana]|uniref:Uncharacterized protein n=1 Tax=Malassezia nana TaxID=180528 RepID=A0AAF0ENX8_9BASI|nr:hypothetical protein MNAN1_000492 [Malassezia nana]